MSDSPFLLPIWYDLLATFAFAITGAMVGIKKHYDIVGVVSLAIAVGVGGGIIRDGVFLQTVPAVVTDWRYFTTILLAVAVAIGVQHWIDKKHFFITVGLLDALGLAAYTVVGTQKAILAGITLMGAILIGVINAAGGGILRDILSGQEPHIFKPSQLYALIAVTGSLLFLLLKHVHVATQLAAIVTIITMIIWRAIVIMLNIKTAPAHHILKKTK